MTVWFVQSFQCNTGDQLHVTVLIEYLGQSFDGAMQLISPNAEYNMKHVTKLHKFAYSKTI